MNTLGRPISSLTNAIQRPSGDTIPDVSMTGLWTIGYGRRSPNNGSSHTSEDPETPARVNAMNRPSRDQLGVAKRPPSSASNSSLEPSSDTWRSENTPSASRSNAIREPSGDQTGDLSSPGSDVSRVELPLATSMT